RALYAALAAAPEPALRAVPGWLAVLAARRVLPLFQAMCPDDEMPPRLLEAATGVLEGRVSAERAAELEREGYRASQSAWGYEEGELPWPVGLAADAAYQALKETLGHRPLADLEPYLGQNTVQLQPDPASEPRATPPSEAAGDDPSDEALCQMDG